MLKKILFKDHDNMRIALYITSILVNGAAIVVRPLAAEWGDALQYVGGAFAAFTGVVALGNVENGRAVKNGDVPKPDAEPDTDRFPEGVL